jgi:hypothetical protein
MVTEENLLPPGVAMKKAYLEFTHHVIRVLSILGMDRPWKSFGKRVTTVNTHLIAE